jgi:two-component system response regulator FixJ
MALWVEICMALSGGCGLLLQPDLPAPILRQNSELDVRETPYGPIDEETTVPETGVVHVVDDDAAVRDSLALLLQSAGLDVRTYPSGAQLLAASPIPGCGCILTDVRMPDIDGLTLQRRLAELGNPLPVIVMTGHGDVPIAVAALKAGAADFLEKPFDEERLIQVVNDALAASVQARQRDVATEEIAARLATLTPKEHEVLDRLVTGQPNKIIAYELGSSPRTVEVHRARVMEKMAARSVADLVHMSITLAQGRKPSRG